MNKLTVFMQKRGTAVLLLGAVCFYAASYVPSVFFANISADDLQILVFYHDVFELGHSAAGWALPGASNWFPDWSVCFLLNFLLRDGLLAETLLHVLFFLTWLGLLFAGYRLGGGKRPAVFLSFLILISVLVVRTHLSHIGTMLNTFAGLDLTLLVFRKPSRVRLLGLTVIAFLGAGSDALFTVIFVAPALMALFAKGLRDFPGLKTVSSAAATIFFGALLGYITVPWLIPVPGARGSFTQFHSENIASCAGDIWKDLDLSQNPWFVALFTIDLLILVAGIPALIFFRSRLKKLSSAVVFLLVYTFVLVALNWTALVLTNNWAMRYVYFALIWPPLVGAGFLSEVFPVRSWMVRSLAIGVALYTFYVGLHPLAKSSPYLQSIQRARDLHALLVREHLENEAGFAEYWSANITTFLSGGAVCLRPMTRTEFYHWLSNVQWVLGSPDNPDPKFRFILVSQLDPVALRARFGPPDRIAKIPTDEVWIYNEKNAISYNRIFGGLGNRYTFPESNQMLFPAASLSGETGHLQGTSRIARAGDPAGCVTFGPYLHVRPGRYEVVYRYTYLKPPDPARPVTFDCLLRLAGETYLDVVPLSYRDSTPQVLSRPIVVPPHLEDAAIEMRLHYFGSGDIRVDSLQVTYLGP